MVVTGSGVVGQWQGSRLVLQWMTSDSNCDPRIQTKEGWMERVVGSMKICSFDPRIQWIRGNSPAMEGTSQEGKPAADTAGGGIDKDIVFMGKRSSLVGLQGQE